MFYYKRNKKPKLIVSIVKSYSESDLERLFLFIHALLKSPKMKVVFKVDSSIKEQFIKVIKKQKCHLLFTYNIKESIA